MSPPTRLFIVDDDPFVAKTLGRDLAHETDAEVATFTSPQAALSALDAGRPDAVICDLGMPELDGIELCSRIAAIDPHVACLLMTSASDEDGTARALRQVGPLRHVHKPCALPDLLPKLRAALDHRSLERALAEARATIAAREQALRASQRQVETATAQLESKHSELETATERLVASEQLAAVGRVVTGIAHEIDNQLALVGYAEAIKTRVADDPELVEFADVIVSAQKRLSAMVEEIRDFVSGDRAELDREPAELCSIVDDALAILHYDRDVRTRHIERAYQAHPLVALHREKFSQVVINLVSNAVLATRPGDTIQVSLWSAPERGYCALTVTDRGTGMPPHVLSRLGEPFFTTRGDRGSGLGVGICMRIVEEHGGSLVYCSEVGAGTIARVRLPLLGERS